MDPLIKIVKVATATGFDKDTLLPTRNVVVTYTIGEHGPFILVTPQSEFTDAYVDAETMKQLNILRAIGAVK